jgi:hypothetical protein
MAGHVASVGTLAGRPEVAVSLDGTSVDMEIGDHEVAQWCVAPRLA